MKYIIECKLNDKWVMLEADFDDENEAWGYIDNLDAVDSVSVYDDEGLQTIVNLFRLCKPELLFAGVIR